MSKRETALTIIKTEWAENGKDTIHSIRAFVENRISKQARDKATEAGLRIFETRDKFKEDEISKAWGKGNTVTYKGKEYRVCKMSYGDYFLEHTNWEGGERDGFSEDTLWLEKAKNNSYFYEVAEK